MIHLDTHVAAWLYAGRSDLLSKRATDLIEKNELRVSPMVVLELEYLHEIGRVRAAAAEIVDALGEEIEVAICDLAFSEVARQAITEKWTRDPFDRLIVSQARLARVPLLTKDESIREQYADAVWD